VDIRNFKYDASILFVSEVILTMQDLDFSLQLVTQSDMLNRTLFSISLLVITTMLDAKLKSTLLETLK
jgi:hypothetical protein